MREKRNVTQDALAKHLDVSRPTLIGYESGKQSINVSDLYSLADFFDIEIYDLVPSLEDIKKLSSLEIALEKNENIDVEVKKEIKEFIKEMRKE